MIPFQDLAGKVSASAEFSNFVIKSDAVVDFKSTKTPKMNFNVTVIDAIVREDVLCDLRVVFDVPEVTDISGHVTFVAPLLIPDAVNLDVQIHQDPKVTHLHIDIKKKIHVIKEVYLFDVGGWLHCVV